MAIGQDSTSSGLKQMISGGRSNPPSGVYPRLLAVEENMTAGWLSMRLLSWVLPRPTRTDVWMTVTRLAV